MTTWTEGQELRSPEEVQAAKADGCGVEYRTPDGHWYPCTCSGRMNGLHRVASVPVPVYPEPMRAHDAWLAVERARASDATVEYLSLDGRWWTMPLRGDYPDRFWKDKDHPVIVRVTPKPTERVPWYEARGRKLPDGDTITDERRNAAHPSGAVACVSTGRWFDADADGQVEVLPVEGE